jgi:threonine/homoserine/homoserine lactone efflux protein
MSPGPSLAVVLSNTWSGGKSVGICTSLLHGFGVGCYALLVVTGASLILQTHSCVQSMLEIGGAGLLCWLAWQSWPRLSSGQNSPSQVNTISVWNGFLIVIFNPKITIFFLAIFSPNLGNLVGWPNWFSLALMVGTIDATWYIIVVMFASIPRFQISGKIWKKRIEKFMSIIMILIALEIFFKQLLFLL